MKKLLVVILIICTLFSFAACGKDKGYDVSKEDIGKFLWENCCKDLLDGKITYVNSTYAKPYIYISCGLPKDKKYNEVEPILKELEQSIVGICSETRFEPCNTFLQDQYYTVYIEFINPRQNRPNNYSRTAGILKIETEFFPIENSYQEKAICYY